MPGTKTGAYFCVSRKELSGRRAAISVRRKTGAGESNPNEGKTLLGDRQRGERRCGCNCVSVRNVAGNAAAHGAGLRRWRTLDGRSRRLRLRQGRIVVVLVHHLAVMLMHLSHLSTMTSHQLAGMGANCRHHRRHHRGEQHCNRRDGEKPPHLESRTIRPVLTLNQWRAANKAAPLVKFFVE